MLTGMPHSSARDCNLRGSQYRYLPDLLAIDSCRSSGRIPRPDSVSSVSPLDVVPWRWELVSYADQSFPNYILDGLTDGFRIDFAYGYAKCKSAKQNMQSATANSLVVDSYLRAEVAASRVRCCASWRVNSSGKPDRLVPKNHQPGRWRLIVDLSARRLASVNEGIATDLCSLSYVRVDEAARRLLQLGPEALMAKLDIESAYRQIQVHPDDRHLLSVRWKNMVYLDCALPFGLR